jgi:transcriptional accessory protein Tex/SPT6
VRTAVEGSVDLLVVVAILSEDVLQEHQLGLQAIFITESSASVYQSE